MFSTVSQNTTHQPTLKRNEVELYFIGTGSVGKINVETAVRSLTNRGEVTLDTKIDPNVKLLVGQAQDLLRKLGRQPAQTARRILIICGDAELAREFAQAKESFSDYPNVFEEVVTILDQFSTGDQDCQNEHEFRLSKAVCDLNLGSVNECIAGRDEAAIRRRMEAILNKS